ncbi:hypothetical protein ACH5RR_041439 [Cinchona calisaya]|uniref:CAF17 C-terminal domain-containing protein n=1 Tax=Cinchona calisaya TaxID=153742 RepID=A0ABD2XYT6_9GENT
MFRVKFSLQFLKPNYPKPKPIPFSTNSENAGSVACQLKTRSVIRFKGPDTVKFLQGLVTNDVRRLSEVSSENTSSSATVGTPNLPVVVVPPVYAALLTPQGRFLYDMFLYRPPRPDQKLNSTGSGPGPSPEELELFADVDGSSLDELLVILKKYRLRSKVDIESVAEDFFCWQRFGWNLSEKSSSAEEPEAASVGWGGSIDQSGMASSHGNTHGWQWNKDPRLDCLGFRGIFPSYTAPPLVEADKEADEKNYLLWRLEKGVAEGPSEIPKGEAIPLEYNLAGLNAISFDKGCYIGQELIARSHHRGVIRKRLIPLQFLDDRGKEVEETVVPRSEVIDIASGKKVGTVTTALGSRGLGLLRLGEAFKGPGSLAIQGEQDVKIKTSRPDWWPGDWYSDYQRSATA